MERLKRFPPRFTTAGRLDCGGEVSGREKLEELPKQVFGQVQGPLTLLLFISS